MPPTRRRAVGGLEAPPPPPTADYAAIPSTMHRLSEARRRRKSRGLLTCACPAGTGRISPGWLFRLSARNARRAGGRQGSRVGSRLRSTRGSSCKPGLARSKAKPIQPRARLTHHQRFTKRHLVRPHVQWRDTLPARRRASTNPQGTVAVSFQSADGPINMLLITPRQNTEVQKQADVEKQGASACEWTHYTKCIDHAKNDLQIPGWSAGVVARHDCGSGFALAHPCTGFALAFLGRLRGAPGLVSGGLARSALPRHWLPFAGKQNGRPVAIVPSASTSR